MAVLSIHVHDIDTQRVLDALCSNYNYQANIPDPNDNTKSIPNTVTQNDFALSIICNFISQNVQHYERTQLESQITVPDITVQNNEQVKPYMYYMICPAPYKDKYDGLASLLVPGISFNVQLADENNILSHYAAQSAISEDVKSKLSLIENMGATENSGGSLYYVRCDAGTSISQATNIEGFQTGNKCILDNILTFLKLHKIGE